MSRVLCKTQAWGTLQKLLELGGGTITALAPDRGVTVNMNVPMYEGRIGTTLVNSYNTNEAGEIPGWVEEGPVTLNVNGVSYSVEAVRAKLTPYAFGAVGDGVTDDTVALQSWLDVGGFLELPAGTFLYRTIQIPSNTVLTGQGQGVSILKTSPILPGLYGLKSAAGAKDITIEKLTMDGNRVAYSAADPVANPDTAPGGPGAAAGPSATIMFPGTSASPCERIYIRDVEVKNSFRISIALQYVRVGEVYATTRDGNRDGVTLYYGCRDITGDVASANNGDDHFALDSGLIGGDFDVCERNNFIVRSSGPSFRGKGRAAFIRGGRNNKVTVLAHDMSSAAVEVSNVGTSSVDGLDLHIEASWSSNAPIADVDGVTIKAIDGGTVKGVRLSGRVKNAPNSAIRVINGKSVTADYDLSDLRIHDFEASGCAVDGIAMNHAGVNDVTLVDSSFHNSGGWGLSVNAAVKNADVRDCEFYRNANGARMIGVVGGAFVGNSCYSNTGTGILFQNLSSQFDFIPSIVTGNGTDFTDSGGHTAVFVQGLRLPWSVDIDPLMPAILETGTWNRNQDSALYYGGQRNNAGGIQNDEIGWDVLLGAGTWRLEVIHTTDSNRGIYSIRVDGSQVTTLDGYSGVTIKNVGATTANFAVSLSTSVKKRLSLKMATKNASSSAYTAGLQRLRLTRVA